MGCSLLTSQPRPVGQNHNTENTKNHMNVDTRFYTVAKTSQLKDGTDIETLAKDLGKETGLAFSTQGEDLCIFGIFTREDLLEYRKKAAILSGIDPEVAKGYTKTANEAIPECSPTDSQVDECCGVCSSPNARLTREVDAAV